MLLFLDSIDTKALAVDLIIKSGKLSYLVIEPSKILFRIMGVYQELKYLCPDILNERYADLFYMYIKHHEEVLIPKDDATVKVLHKFKSKWLSLLSREDMRQTS